MFAPTGASQTEGNTAGFANSRSRTRRRRIERERFDASHEMNGLNMSVLVKYGDGDIELTEDAIKAIQRIEI